VTSEAPVLAALDAIGAMIWDSMLEVFPAEGGADDHRRRRVAGAGEIAASDRSDDGDGDRGVMVMSCPSPIDGIGHNAAGTRVPKVSMMIIRPPQQGQAFHSL